MSQSPDVPDLDLDSLLPALLPKAIRWAQEMETAALAAGIPLNAACCDVARAVGVVSPERIRLVVVAELPQPDDPLLRQAAHQVGLLGPGMAGITFGYGIYIRQDQRSPRLLKHECRHVYQYESAGGIAAFLPGYVGEIRRYGYANAPLELDARAAQGEATASG